MTKPNDLNEAQWQAVTHQGSHLLIVAGPGTGKTHTLVRRIAHIIPSIPAHENVLAVTFTNKAAAQMKDRLMSLGVPQKQTFIGTFHAFCLKLLREHWEWTALPKDFQVIMPEEVEGFDKAALERIGLMKSTHLVIEGSDEYKTYQRALKAKSCIDFDDILRETLNVLEEESVARMVRASYTHIFVDEYQDLNPVQHAVLKMIAGNSSHVTAIGDPDQAIYGFRGSDMRLFSRFMDDFPGASCLRLRENYRSSPNLLNASGQIIRTAGKDNDVALIARIHSEGKLIVHRASTDRAEADYVAGQIEKMVGGMDMQSARAATRSFGDIAVLYRLNAQRHVISQALDHLAIPFQVSAKPPKADTYSDEAALGRREEVLDYNTEKVSLMTIHAAKGLEFPVVFIVGCEENILPLNILEMKGDSDEERRLFYVGMTRARSCLYLTYAERRQLFGKTLLQSPSPFLTDIAEDLKAYEAARLRKPKKSAAPDTQMKLF